MLCFNSLEFVEEFVLLFMVLFRFIFCLISSFENEFEFIINLLFIFMNLIVIWEKWM